MHRQLIAVAVIFLLVAPALAQDGEPGAGRYQITPSEEGFTRLDTETGSLSHCGQRDGVWYCENLAGAEPDLKREIDGLADAVARLSANLDVVDARIGALAARVDALAAQLASASASAGPAAEHRAGLVERVMRRFFAMVRAMKRPDVDSI